MKRLPELIFISLVIGFSLWFIFLLTQVNLQVLNPKGLIAAGEARLIMAAMGIMLPITIVVVLIAYFVAWRYREGASESSHSPNWTGNKYLKVSYWGFFGILALIFFAFVWIGAHELDPYKPIVNENKPITIQVVALQWKWLFIYPEENIATVNFIQIPINTPVNFEMTADAPMSSMWIPQLAGQMYLMSAMETKLHILGDTIGDFQGGAAEINGVGFSGMRFTTRVSTKDDYDSWVEKVKSESNPLSENSYRELVIPSEYDPVIFFSSVDSGIYDNVMMKYMVPPGINNHIDNKSIIHQDENNN